jgi:uncharacterized protein (TIGR03437 family)
MLIQSRCIRTLALFAVAFSTAFGQRVITTFAGADWLFSGDGRPAINAPLGGTLSLDVATDRNGNFYILDEDNSIVSRVGADGILNVVAGNGLLGRTGDGGLAVNASLNTPNSFAVDSRGNIYIGDSGGQVRRVTPDGIINVYAGAGNHGYSGDSGPALLAQFGSINGLAVDSAGNLYISDTDNQVIRKVSSDGIVTTFAGNGKKGFSGDNGPATSAQLNNPTRIAVDLSGNLYIVDLFNGRLRKVSAGIITTVTGGGSDFSENIPAAKAAALPQAVAVDSSSNIFIADSFFAGIRKIDTSGKINTIAGTGTGDNGFAGDGGPALKALFHIGIYPSLAVDSNGNILVGDDQNRRVRKLTPDGNVNTVAGNGLYRFSGDGGPAASATLNLPGAVLADSKGNVFISEIAQNLIRKVAPDGTISVYAGSGLEGYSGDNGPAIQASLYFPTFLTFGPDGSLFVSDTLNNAIRKIDNSGVITTYAATTTHLFDSPAGIAFDGAGNLIIADMGNSRIRVVNAAVTSILTIAGTSGVQGFSGDGGLSSAALVNKPTGLVFFNNAVYFSDSGNNRVRRIDGNDFKITTVAGNGTAGYSGDGGMAKDAALYSPQGLAFDSAGNLYIADSFNYSVRKVTPSGVISTVAGSPTSSILATGGPATSIFLLSPQDVTVDAAGNIFIAEEAGNRVSEVLVNSPTFQVSTNTLAFTAPAGSSQLDQSISLNGSIRGLAYNVSVPASSPWLTVTPATGTTPITLRITADPSKLAPGSNQAIITITAPDAKPPVQTVSVSLTTTAAGQPSLSVNPASLNFSYVQQSAARSRTLSVANIGGGSLNVNLTATTTAGGGWLKVSNPTAALGAFASTSVNITADPTGLAPGVYSGVVTTTSVNPAQSVIVPVNMTVSAVQQTILIPQSGLTFFAVQGGGPTTPQFFNILNTGRGQMSWTVQSSTLSGGSWLSVFPGSGLSDADSALVPTVRLDVNPKNLTPGTYVATIQVTAPGADNSPQFVSVFLNVLPPGSNIGPIVQPSALVFSAVAGGEAPGSQAVLVQSLSTNPITFTAGRVTSNGKDLVTILPGDGTITSAQPQRLVIQPKITGLAPGIYRGTLTLSFSDGNTRNIAIVLVIVSSGGSRSSSPESLAQAQAGCAPTTLAPVFTLLLDGFNVPVGFPGQVAVKVIDDCANLMTSGNVAVSFSNGDSPIRLDSLKDGSWTQTWTPQHTVSSITVTADAEVPEQKVKGQVKIKGGFLALASPPVVPAGAVVNGASFAAQGPLAPGSLISIFGNKLAGAGAADRLPLPMSLGGSTVVIAGVAMPLLFSSDGQVNAVVPFETTVNTTQQMILTRGSSTSVPQALTISAAAPGIFTADSSGKGQGIIFGPSGSVADAAHPVKAGDVVVIYCTGLGKVDHPVPTGSPAPISPLSNVLSQTSVTIGGTQVAPMFAGLTPGFVGLYQVNVGIPSGIASGDQVPVFITAAGQNSLPVTIAIR